MSNLGQSMQPGTQQPQVEVDLDVFVQTLTAQRNQALDGVAQLQGVIARQGKRIAELEAQLAEGKQFTNGKDKEVRAS